ncbi:MAG: hypothetical protein JO141_07300 [Bradyrhizobium sp.]|nr:hypothetical protein [Bradyrhizobium sp.]
MCKPPVLLKEKLENEKAEASLILEVVKTLSPERAADNLKFLVDTKLITSKTRRDDISAYIKTREAGKGVFIPPISPAPDRLIGLSVSCVFHSVDPRPFADALDKAMATSKELKSKDVDSSRPWTFGDNDNNAQKVLSGGMLGRDITIELVKKRVDTLFMISINGPILPQIRDVILSTLGSVADESLNFLPGKTTSCQSISFIPGPE